jgi:hypothetical protein
MEKGRSCVGGYFFLCSIPHDRKLIQLNGNVAVTYAILKIVVASAAEAEFSALFVNMKEARIV